MAAETHLTNKRELRERFILENLAQIEDKETILQEFEKYWDEEQPKNFNILIKKKSLKKTKMPKLIEDYLFAGRKPIRVGVLDFIGGKKRSVLKRKVNASLIKKVSDFINTFISGFKG